MKKLFLAATMFLAMTSTSVFAFVPQMSYFVNQTVATARVWNYTSQPVVCSGTAFGRTYQGVVLDSWFNQVYIAPGVYADAFVYSNVYDPFVNVWAQVDCQFSW